MISKSHRNHDANDCCDDVWKCAAKKQAENPLFREKSCVAYKNRKVIHSQTVRTLPVSFAVPKFKYSARFSFLNSNEN